MALAMVVFVVFVVLVVGALVAVATSFGQARSEPSRARNILDERLAAGEISDEDYQSRLTLLDEDSQSPGVRRKGLIVSMSVGALLLLLLLVLIPLAMQGPGWNGGQWGHMGGGHMWGGGRGSAPPTISGAREIVVVGTDFAFAPNRIEVGRNEAVNVAFENKGSVYHTLTVVGTGFDIGASPGERVAGSLSIAAPGTYEIVCAVPGHTEAGMKGTLTVT